MKKILFAIVSIFALVGCSYDDVESIIPTVPADGTVAVQLGVQVPEMQSITRSMAAPAIKSLHLVVFDENGYFVEAAEATGIPANGDENTPKDPSANQEYSVELTQSAQPRIVHFIANSPLATNQYKYASERELINALETSMYTDDVSGKVVWPDAYWQRKELESILGDQKNAAGKVIASSDSKLAHDLSLIPLVRNFAKVSVNNLAAEDESKGNFVYEGIAIYNAPTKGKVAPYNTNAGEYAAYNHDIDYATLTSAGYYGYEPANLVFANTDFAPEQYIYEFKHSGKTLQAGNSYPFVIIKGKYKGEGGKTSYYKVDLTYKVNEDDIEPVYYNILRNFNYVINIKHVGSDGYATPGEAAAAAASNNISASVDTRNLLNISDGKSALYVEYINKFLTAQGTVTLKYKYVPDISKGATSNSSVVVTKGAGGDTGEVINGEISNDQAANGWATISFVTTGIGANVKNQSITLSAGALSRTVNYTLRAPFALEVQCPDEAVETEVATPLTVNLKIPAELPDAIFPLEFVIVSSKKSISPDATQENMPVKTGLNAQGQEVDGGQYFGFVKTVTYDQYVNRDANGNITGYNTTIPCHFKTALANSGSVVSAYNPYFNMASDRFRNPPASYTYDIEAVLGANAAVYGAGQEVTLDITLPEAPEGVSVSVEATGFDNIATRAPFTTDANGQVKLKMKTTAWGGERTVTVRCAGQQPIENDWGDQLTYNYADVSVTASKLYIPAGSFKATPVPTEAVSVKVGSTTASETITFNADGTNAAATVTLAGLSENSAATMTLSYTNNGATSTATTTVGAAMSKETNDIRFITRKDNQITVDLNGNAKSYYGEGHNVTATITIPDASALTLSVDQIVSNYVTLTGFEYITDNSYTSTTNTSGSLVITLNLTTSNWSGTNYTRSVNVAALPSVTNETEEITWTEGTGTGSAPVNTLYIPAGKIKWANSGGAVSLRVGNTNYGEIGSNNSTQNYDVALPIEGLAKDDTRKFYLRYGTSSSNRRYSNKTFTCADIMNVNGVSGLTWQKNQPN